MIAFMAVKVSLNGIEDYYLQRTISKGAILKKALKEYKKNHKKFPKSLDDLYKEYGATQYHIGLRKYYFRYYKTDTSYRLYFNHFHGSMFQNYGESNVWNFDD